jgi:hypothetical protein
MTPSKRAPRLRSLQPILIEWRREHRSIRAYKHQGSGRHVPRQQALGEDVPLAHLQVKGDNIEVRRIQVSAGAWASPLPFGNASGQA